MSHPQIIDPRRAALAIIDMQNAFLDPDVGFRFAPAALEVVDPINDLARRFRAAGATVTWVQTTSRSSSSDWPSLRHLLGNESMEFRAGVLAEGSHGHTMWRGMDVAPGDDVVLKYRYSAMVEPGGDLQVLLEERDITALYVVGTQTNICCEATARDAMMLGLDTFMVADCLAAETIELHRASLASFRSAFGQVVESADLHLP